MNKQENKRPEKTYTIERADTETGKVTLYTGMTRDMIIKQFGFDPLDYIWKVK